MSTAIRMIFAAVMTPFQSLVSLHEYSGVEEDETSVISVS